MSLRFTDVLAWTVFVLWAAGFVYDMVSDAYSMPGPIHGLMTIIATAAYGSNAVRKVKNGGDD